LSAKYFQFVGDHADHPGEGKGRGARVVPEHVPPLPLGMKS
jgi:hypothetical protein